VRALRWIVLLAGTLWTSPNTLLGLVLGALGGWRGARCRLGDAAIVFENYPWGPGGALTLGQVILVRGTTLDARCVSYARRAGCEQGPRRELRLGDHERAHVYQYLVFGPLFLPLYLACGGIAARNPFERAADRYALSGRGWWPWRS
jgi:hypothetical protein